MSEPRILKKASRKELEARLSKYEEFCDKYGPLFEESSMSDITLSISDPELQAFMRIGNIEIFNHRTRGIIIHDHATGDAIAITTASLDGRPRADFIEALRSVL